LGSLNRVRDTELATLVKRPMLPEISVPMSSRI